MGCNLVSMLNILVIKIFYTLVDLVIKIHIIFFIYLPGIKGSTVKEIRSSDEKL